MLFRAAIVLSVLAMQSPRLDRPVELRDDPNFKLLLQNEAVRVWRVDVPSRGETRDHAHRYDYLAIALNDARVEHSVYAPHINVIGETMASREVKRGETWYMHGGYHHVVRNTAGLDAAQGIEVEIMQLKYSGNALKDLIDDFADAQQINPPVDPEGTYHQEAYFYSTYVYRDRLNPGGETADIRHDYDHLLIALTDLKLTDKRDGRSADRVTMNKGEARWIKGGYTHRLMNETMSPAEFVTIEIR